MSTVEISPISVAGLTAICVTVPGMAWPLSIRVVETPTARLVDRLARRAQARATRRGERARIDLDELVARAEIISARGLAP